MPQTSEARSNQVAFLCPIFIGGLSLAFAVWRGDLYLSLHSFGVAVAIALFAVTWAIFGCLMFSARRRRPVWLEKVRAGFACAFLGSIMALGPTAVILGLSHDVVAGPDATVVEYYSSSGPGRTCRVGSTRVWTEPESVDRFCIERPDGFSARGQRACMMSTRSAFAVRAIQLIPITKKYQPIGGSCPTEMLPLA